MFQIAGVMSLILLRQVQLRVLVDSDPITAFLSRDWAAVGGWGLFLGLAMFIVYGAFRETWVPGTRYKRQEALLLEANALIKQQADQITKLTEANELTKYVMEQVIPIRKGDRSESPAHAPTTEGKSPT